MVHLNTVLQLAYRNGAKGAVADITVPADAATTLIDFIKSPDPSPVTVRMQAAFDAAYFEAQSQLERKSRARSRQLAEIATTIETLAASNVETDLSKLALLGKQVLAYITAYMSVDPRAAQASASDEVSAALDSVFPRVGLKAFAKLGQADRVAQLDELAHLVLGIRLLAWASSSGGGATSSGSAQGHGGTGLEDTPGLAVAEAETLKEELRASLTAATGLAAQYTQALMAVKAGALRVSQLGEQWPSELVNRRQLATFLQVC
jgi:hypothetical protein